MEPGSIILYIGPMFAGKTTRMISEVEKRQFAGDWIFIKPITDTRNKNDFIETHNGMTVEAHSTKKLLEFSKEKLEVVKTIGIDEGQFFDDIFEFSEAMAKKGKTIIISALDGTYLRKPWENISKLIPSCEHVEKINSICGNCLNPNGSFSYRTVSCDEEVLIGSSDKYMSLCRKCFYSWTSDTGEKSGEDEKLLKKKIEPVLLPIGRVIHK